MRARHGPSHHGGGDIGTDGRLRARITHTRGGGNDLTLYFLVGLVLGLAVGAWIGGFGPGLLYCGLIGGLGGWVLHLSFRIKELETTREIDAAAGLHAPAGSRGGRAGGSAIRRARGSG